MKDYKKFLNWLIQGIKLEILDENGNFFETEMTQIIKDLLKATLDKKKFYWLEKQRAKERARYLRRKAKKEEEQTNKLKKELSKN